MLRGELDDLWGEIDHIWQFIVAEHEHEHHHDYDYDYDADYYDYSDYEEGREHNHEHECEALKGFLFHLGQSADNDQNMGISLEEMHKALEFAMMPDAELASVVSMII